MLEELRKALHDASTSRKDLDSKVTSSPTPDQTASLVLVTERRHVLRPQRAIQDLATELVLWSNANEPIRSAKGEEHTTSNRRGDRDQPAPEAARYEGAPGGLEDDRPRRVQPVEPPKEKEQESKPKGIMKPPRVVPFPEEPYSQARRAGATPARDASLNQEQLFPSRPTRLGHGLTGSPGLNSASQPSCSYSDPFLKEDAIHTIATLYMTTNEFREALGNFRSTASTDPLFRLTSNRLLLISKLLKEIKDAILFCDEDSTVAAIEEVNQASNFMSLTFDRMLPLKLEGKSPTKDLEVVWRRVVDNSKKGPYRDPMLSELDISTCLLQRAKSFMEYPPQSVSERSYADTSVAEFGETTPSTLYLHDERTIPGSSHYSQPLQSYGYGQPLQSYGYGQPLQGYGYGQPLQGYDYSQL